jgi:hypothetical protein
MTRSRENADGARLDAVNRTADNATVALKAPLASPVLVTPNLGTPSAGVITNLTGTGTNLTFVNPALGTPASGVVTNLSGVLPSGVTGGSGLTALGTVTAGNLANNNIVMPRFKEFDTFYDPTSTPTTTSSLLSLNISHTYYVVITPDHVNDVLEWGYQMNLYLPSGYVGLGLQRSGASNFIASAGVPLSTPTTIWSTGQYANSGVTSENYQLKGGVIHTTCAGLTVGTSYYYRMIGMTHSAGVSATFGPANTNNTVGEGVRLTVKRWSIA